MWEHPIAIAIAISNAFYALTATKSIAQVGTRASAGAGCDDSKYTY